MTMSMETASTVTRGAEDVVLLVERTFDAPREAVFRAWTEPERLARWFGPHGSTIPFCEMDVRPGGVLRFCHRFPGGEDVWARGVYEEVDAPGRLVFTASFSDEQGNVVERPGFAFQTRIAVTFVERDGGTHVTMRQTGLPADQGERQGWIEAFERLARHLAA